VEKGAPLVFGTAVTGCCHLLQAKGLNISVDAGVVQGNDALLTGCSAHAGQGGLVEWVNSMPKRPRKIKLVHGEKKDKMRLRWNF